MKEEKIHDWTCSLKPIMPVRKEPLEIVMYRYQLNVYTGTTGPETYLGVQKPKRFDLTMNFFCGIGNLMASTKIACFTQHRTFKLYKTTQ